MYVVPWAAADLSPFDPSNSDRSKIETGHPVPCRLCEAVYRVLTVTMRYCASCEQGYCQSQHGGWIGRRGACVRCGPYQTDSLPAVAYTDEQPRVHFDVFLSRLKQEFESGPEVEPGVHFLDVDNWTRDGRGASDTFGVFWKKGGETFQWKGAQFSRAEIEKVYDVWLDYVAGRIGRGAIRHTVYNTKPIFSLFKKFEHLMY